MDYSTSRLTTSVAVVAAPTVVIQPIVVAATTEEAPPAVEALRSSLNPAASVFVPVSVGMRGHAAAVSPLPGMVRLDAERSANEAAVEEKRERERLLRDGDEPPSLSTSEQPQPLTTASIVEQTSSVDQPKSAHSELQEKRQEKKEQRREQWVVRRRRECALQRSAAGAASSSSRPRLVRNVTPTSLQSGAGGWWPPAVARQLSQWIFDLRALQIAWCALIVPLALTCSPTFDS